MSQKALRESWTAYAEQHGLVKERREPTAEPATRPNKYGAVRWTVVDGITFDSKKEAAYYEQLKLRQMAGEIADLELQPTFPLHVMQLWRPDEIAIETIGVFTADFRFLELVKPRGEIKVIDVKSDVTRKGEAYRLRKKLAEAVHGMTVEEG